jgi:hypothetical protein
MAAFVGFMALPRLLLIASLFLQGNPIQKVSINNKANRNVKRKIEYINNAKHTIGISFSWYDNIIITKIIVTIMNVENIIHMQYIGWDVILTITINI